MASAEDGSPEGNDPFHGRRQDHRRTWRFIGVVGLIAVAYVSAMAWQHLSTEADVAGPTVTTSVVPATAGQSSEVEHPSSAPPVRGDSQVLDEPCGRVSTGFIDAIRSCRVLRPVSPPASPMPVVLVLHGLAGDIPSTVEIAGLREAVSRDGFVAVVPQGVLGSWNAGRCCGLAQTSGSDDVTYLRNLLETVSRTPGVDRGRRYAVGFSNGGMMAYRLLCDAQSQLVGIVSVMGTDVAGCAPAAPASVLHIAGTGDTAVPYDGGRSVVAAVLGVDLPPVESTLEALAADFGCARKPATTRQGRGVVRRDWTGCRDSARVELLTLDGVGHEWPRGNPIDATETALRFLGVASR